MTILENIDIHIDKHIFENIDIDKDIPENIDIDMEISENIDIFYINIYKDILSEHSIFSAKSRAFSCFVMKYRYRLSIYWHFLKYGHFFWEYQYRQNIDKKN